MTIEHSNIPSELTKAMEIKNKIKENILDKRNIGTDLTYKHEIVWKNAIGFLILHFFAVWGLYLLVTGHIKPITALWGKYSHKK